MVRIRIIKLFINNTFRYPSGQFKMGLYVHNKMSGRTYRRLLKFEQVVRKEYEHNFKKGTFIDEDNKLRARYWFARKEKELDRLQKIIRCLLNTFVDEC